MTTPVNGIYVLQGIVPSQIASAPVGRKGRRPLRRQRQPLLRRPGRPDGKRRRPSAGILQHWRSGKLSVLLFDPAKLGGGSGRSVVARRLRGRLLDATVVDRLRELHSNDDQPRLSGRLLRRRGRSRTVLGRVACPRRHLGGVGGRHGHPHPGIGQLRPRPESELQDLD